MAGPRRQKKPAPRRTEPQHQTNERIRYPEVRVVGEDIETQVVPTEDALRIAREKGLDLVLISEKANPPVCRVVDYGKFLYEQKKKQKELKQKNTKVVVKEIRFGPNTDDHDFNFKLKHGEKFLEEGAKLKAFVQFRGRAIVHKERGEYLLLKFADELKEYGKVESMPKLEGKRMTMHIAPKTSKKKKSDAQDED